MMKPIQSSVRHRGVAGGWNRRDFLRTLGAGAATLAAPSILRGTTPLRRPNIVLIMADDMGFSDLGCYGSEIPTPHLDSLAARGVRYSQFYNCAVCCPTRAALLTGLYPHQAGMGWMVSHGADTRPPGPYQGYLNQRCVTLAEMLKGAGYRTLMSGKWHVGESRPHWPVDRGFDHSFGLISGASNYFDLAKDYLPGITRQMFTDDRPYDPPASGFYMTDAIVEQAVAQLQDAAQAPEPFFQYLSFTAPHFPLHAPEAAIARHRGRYRAGWDVIRQERFSRMQAMGIIGPQTKLSPRDPGVEAWSEVQDPELMDLRMAIYAAQVELMDTGIGRVLATLRATGAEENTVVIFLSDNGGAPADLSSFRPEKFNRAPYLGGPESYDGYGKSWANVSDTPFRKFKGMLEEGGIATPLIVAGPGVDRPPGSLCHEFGHIIDFMPTFMELARADYTAHRRGNETIPYEGVSLVRSWRGGSIPRTQPLRWELEGQRAVRDGDWKLLGREDAPWELYHLAADRNELRNLAADHPERVSHMVADYTAWADRCGVDSWKKVSPNLRNIPGIR